ncbi:hypothetical protein A3Q56_08178 [Intoshia linei]|uniref:Ubiquitin-like domain-containing protein n=1 Tax=Intoshia linei TaxID=1819745 RepID=A0A177ARH7_9BILA|nr:hypothetical protein A3Q56_08178 [Intoshia linei]
MVRDINSTSIIVRPVSGGQDMVIRVYPYEHLSVIRQQVQLRIGPTMESSKLMCNGEELSDDLTLNDYSLDNYQILMIEIFKKN